MKRLIAALIGLILCLTGASTAAAADGGPAPPGPAWWKITNGGGSTLWILAIPDAVLTSLKWNDASLIRRMESARILISPPLQMTPEEQAYGDDLRKYSFPTTPGAAPNDTYLPSGGHGGPPGSGAIGGPTEANLLWHSVIGRIFFDDPLSGRASPALLQRLQTDLPVLLGDPDTAVLHARTLDIALWMDLWNWPRNDRIGNQVTDEAQALAQNRHLPIDSIPVRKLWEPQLIARFNPPESVQQACLAEVLTQTESGALPALRLAGLQAWARGDVANALRRSNSVQYCLMGTPKSTTAQDYLQSQAYLYFNRTDHAFDAPGQTVALVEFDPLLLEKGGVLDHYRKLGYDIAVSDGME